MKKIKNEKNKVTELFDKMIDDGKLESFIFVASCGDEDLKLYTYGTMMDLLGLNQLATIQLSKKFAKDFEKCKA